MNLNSSRRGFLGTLGAVAAALSAPHKLFAAKPFAEQTAPAITGLGQSGNPYQELGVTTVINGEGTMTTLGGSLIRPAMRTLPLRPCSWQGSMASRAVLIQASH